MSYRVRLTPAASRALANELPTKVAEAAIALIFGDLKQNPRRVGKPLEAPLAPAYVARRGSYRVIYLINDDEVEILVTKIAHRAWIYRSN